MKIFLASDHAGVELKSYLYLKLMDRHFLPELRQTIRHMDVVDLGPQSTDSVDYPDYANILCHKLHGFSVIDSNPSEKKLTHLTELGILICGSGQGMAIRANKFPHIRAALVYSAEIATLSREHNDANVLCLGSRFTTQEQAAQYLEIFLNTSFAGGRHLNRVVKLNAPV